MNYPTRVPLGHFPTRIEKLERLSRHLGGPEIYIKRDDQTGLATGGNKVRKLEFLIADALAQRCDHLVTLGGPQSNHCRQTAAAAAKLGLECSVVLRGDRPERYLGNLLLDELLGAQILWSGGRSREEVAEELIVQLRAEGKQPYLVPLGGSTALGTLGYAAAMQESTAQLEESNIPIDLMVVASSSAGTQAGLVLGDALSGYRGRVLGISIDSAAADLARRVQELALGAAALLGVRGDHVQAGRLMSKIDINADYLGGGYAVVGPLERDAIRTVARTEGVLLDPVYTGRAMGACMDLIHQGAIGKGQRVLFWHTGGAAALSGFYDELM
ncbi:MAG: D-cysteine desulfhydrase family protein [Pseudomonadota bacterium]|nr:D-cysteine desulfhydrase family protein [Pseudomonadota bacterium]